MLNDERGIAFVALFFIQRSALTISPFPLPGISEFPYNDGDCEAARGFGVLKPDH